MAYRKAPGFGQISELLVHKANFEVFGILYGSLIFAFSSL